MRYLATANSGSDDVTIFSLQAGTLDAGNSDLLPLGDVNPQALAASLDGAYLATANSFSNSITLFKVAAGTLDQGTSYSLPLNSAQCVGIAFSPARDGNSYVATANFQSNDVSLFPLLGGQNSGNGDGNVPLGVIIGTTIGVPLGLASITAATARVSFLIYKL